MVHRNSFNYPWNGVGVLKKDGSVRVEFENDCKKNPGRIPVYIKGEQFPFYYEETPK